MPFVTDPLGRLIDLTDYRWSRHILTGHPELRGLRAQIELALKVPTVIRQSVSDPDCRPYYAPGPWEGDMSCVVCDVVAGLVKTAYRTSRVKKGVEEWPL